MNNLIIGSHVTFNKNDQIIASAKEAIESAGGKAEVI